MTSKTTAAARNRFIYYPDHLVRMPGPGGTILGQIYNFITEPVFQGLFGGLLLESVQPERRSDMLDESVGSFTSRRVGAPFADNIVSAVLHGIYAGDIYQLSVRSLLPKMWYWEAAHKSVSKALVDNAREKGTLMSEQDAQMMEELAEKPIISTKLKGINTTSVFTFKRGIGELSNRLAESLKRTANVSIKLNTPISAIRYHEGTRGVEVCTLL